MTTNLKSDFPNRIGRPSPEGQGLEIHRCHELIAVLQQLLARAQHDVRHWKRAALARAPADNVTSSIAIDLCGKST